MSQIGIFKKNMLYRIDMIKFALIACSVFTVLACTQAQLDKTNSKIDKISAAVECRAKALKPYEKSFTSDQVGEVLVGKLDPVEVLKAVEEVASKVAEVKEAFKLCEE